MPAELAFVDVLDAVARLVGFILRDGELDVQHQSAVRRRRVVLLLRALPVHMMRVENVLHLVVVADVAEPSVKALEDDDVDFVGADIVKKPLQFLPARQRFPRRVALVCVHIYNGVMVYLCVALKIGTLFADREAVTRLFLGADADVQSRSLHDNRRLSWYNTVDKFIGILLFLTFPSHAREGIFSMII